MKYLIKENANQLLHIIYRGISKNRHLVVFGLFRA